MPHAQQPSRCLWGDAGTSWPPESGLRGPPQSPPLSGRCPLSSAHLQPRPLMASSPHSPTQHLATTYPEPAVPQPPRPPGTPTRGNPSSLTPAALSLAPGCCSPPSPSAPHRSGHTSRSRGPTAGPTAARQLTARWCPGAAVTDDHTLGGLGQWCWRPQVQNQGGYRALLLLKVLDRLLLPPPASRVYQRPSVSLGVGPRHSRLCLRRHMAFSLHLCLPRGVLSKRMPVMLD